VGHWRVQSFADPNSNTNRESYANPNFYPDRYSCRYADSYGNSYSHGHGNSHGNGNAYADLNPTTYTYAKVYPDTRNSANSSAAPLAGDGRWWKALSLARRSLGEGSSMRWHITADSPAAVCTFGDYLSSSSEKQMRLMLIGLLQHFA